MLQAKLYVNRNACSGMPTCMPIKYKCKSIIHKPEFVLAIPFVINLSYLKNFWLRNGKKLRYVIYRY